LCYSESPLASPPAPYTHEGRSHCRTCWWWTHTTCLLCTTSNRPRDGGNTQEQAPCAAAMISGASQGYCGRGGSWHCTVNWSFFRLCRLPVELEHIILEVRSNGRYHDSSLEKSLIVSSRIANGISFDARIQECWVFKYMHVSLGWVWRVPGRTTRKTCECCHQGDHGWDHPRDSRERYPWRRVIGRLGSKVAGIVKHKDMKPSKPVDLEANRQMEVEIIRFGEIVRDSRSWIGGPKAKVTTISRRHTYESRRVV
jgi:hypothetical protein